MSETLLQKLESVLDDIGSIGIALSGGVDSMTLAVIAHRLNPECVTMHHAVSPAVPDDATRRVRRYAQYEGWSLDVFSANEFDDPNYMANPANRCFFCKTNLYDAMVTRTDWQLVSGTNVDDLGDYRPGLDAAKKHNVRHPYVEAGIDKAGVRTLARHLLLDDIAELPAAPCLSSRVETGIAIDPAALQAINAVEKALRNRINPATVRCRVRANEVAIELDQQSLNTLDAEERDKLKALVQTQFTTVAPDLPVVIEAYRMGSAFLVTP